MKLTDIMFSVHDYDRDGDVTKHGIFLHFGDDVRVHVADDLNGLMAVARRIASMEAEIIENYEGQGIF